MHIAHLSLRQFRNLQTTQIEPHERFNIIHGLNGQGKTNLLEAIYWLSALRTPRTTRIRELVRWKSGQCRVEGSIIHEGLSYQFGVEVVDGQRSAFREKKKVQARDYFGLLSAIIFTPDDSDIIRAGPEKRRKYLDRAILTGKSQHLEDYLNYRRALEARNRLLRDQADNALLDAYEAPLARYGANLMNSRHRFVEDLSTRFSETLSSILGPDDPGLIRYRSSVSYQNSNLEEALMSLWKDERTKDRDRGFTVRGPHADELAISLGGRSARTYASKGQQRAIVLALKISEIQILKERFGAYPIVLLDDVSSELDHERNRQLFDFLDRFDGQVFITTTDPKFLLINDKKKLWNVCDGHIHPEEL
ncbi:MAG: DNA replication/repair protein RecF [Myxococcota bacterium]|nr:DNA replication/repair protein RecF [Myxococcota bacterium]